MLETRPPLSEVEQETAGSTGAGGDGAPAEATAAGVPARGRRGSAPPRGARGGGPAPHATPGARDRGGRRRAARTRPLHAAPRAPAEQGRGLALPERRRGSAGPRPAGPVSGSRKARARGRAGGRRPPPWPASRAERCLPSARQGAGASAGPAAESREPRCQGGPRPAGGWTASGPHAGGGLSGTPRNWTLGPVATAPPSSLEIGAFPDFIL